MSEDALKESIAGAPHLPGIYTFVDDSGKILYIGKAKDIRKRLGGHLSTAGDLRHQVLIEKAVSVEWTITNTEVEALILESEMIRLKKPPLNVRMRDSGRYPYIEITTDEEYPRLQITRERENPGGRARFGPYPAMRDLRRLLDILIEAFPLRRCTGTNPPKQKRPCLMGQLGRCPAPCTEETDTLEYENNLNGILTTLNGNWAWAIEKIEKSMKESAEELDFEEAQRLRDLMKRLENFGWPAPESDAGSLSRDVFAVRENWGIIMRIRLGRISSLLRTPFNSKWKYADIPERLSVLIRSAYSDTGDIPKEILTPSIPDHAEMLENWLSTKKEGSVKIRIPEKGALKELLELAERNLSHFLASLAWKRSGQSKENIDAALEALADIFHLSEPPHRIIGLDASNIFDSWSVVALVSFLDGRRDRSGYRKFSIPDAISGNDPAMIASALRRYISHLDLETEIPDIILIDGGVTQLRAAVEAVGENWAADNNVKIVSIAKKEELLIEGITERRIELPMDSLPICLLRSIRDEAHRFVLHFHRQRRSTSELRSIIDEIPGIGKATRIRLLSHFGSAKKVAAASAEEIMEVPGIGRGRAEQIVRYLEIRCQDT